jgi:hypothetical protein
VCWYQHGVDAAHIIPRKARSGVPGFEGVDLHGVQNGLSLCKIHHDDFDSLRMFVNVQRDQNDNAISYYAVFLENLDDDAFMEVVGRYRQIYSRNHEFAQLAHAQIPTILSENIRLFFDSAKTGSWPNADYFDCHRRTCLVWFKAKGRADYEDFDENHNGGHQERVEMSDHGIGTGEVRQDVLMTSGDRGIKTLDIRSLLQRMEELAEPEASNP